MKATYSKVEVNSIKSNIFVFSQGESFRHLSPDKPFFVMTPLRWLISEEELVITYFGCVHIITVKLTELL